MSQKMAFFSLKEVKTEISPRLRLLLLTYYSAVLSPEIYLRRRRKKKKKKKFRSTVSKMPAQKS
jgi:hypothetical protein